MRTKITTMFAILFFTILASAVSAQSQLATPTIKSPGGVSTTGFTAFWTALPAASGAIGYDVKIYDATNSLVSTHNATGETSATLAITGLSLAKNSNYTYTVTAIGDGTIFTNSLESSKSIAFYIQTDDKVVFQYIPTDAALLRNDLMSVIGTTGAADIYELATSGEYVLSTSNTTNMTLAKNTFLRAKTGLATKPIFKAPTSGGGSTTNTFKTSIIDQIISFEGIEFDGTNTLSANKAMLVYASTGANTMIYLKDCYFHDFMQNTGHGVIRMAVASTAGVLDVQNCVFNNCGGKGLNISASAPNTVTVNIKNSTFSNNTLVTNANAIYFSGVNSGTTTIDHCTFYNLISKDAVESVLKFTYTDPLVPVGVTIKNSIFDNVANTAVATFDNCYLAGFTGTDPIGTNTLETAPTYTNAATRDFTLINLSSLICTDGYVVGNTFGAVLTPLNAPVTINNASNLTSTGFTAGWSTVTDASGYIVNLYSDAALVKSVRAITNSADITDLSANTTYTYKVIAIGNATTTSSSTESAASESFSTLTTSTCTLNDNTTIIYRNNQVICSEIGRIELFNLQGTKLLEVKAANKLNVNLTNGIYIVRLASENGKTSVSKIVVR